MLVLSLSQTANRRCKPRKLTLTVQSQAPTNNYGGAGSDCDFWRGGL